MFASGVVLSALWAAAEVGSDFGKLHPGQGWCHSVLSSIVGAFICTGYSWLSPAGSRAKIIAEGNVVHFSLSSLILIQ